MKRDIRADITERMTALEAEIRDLNRGRSILEEQLRAAEERLKALRLVLDSEVQLHGRLVTGRASLGKQSAWLGVSLRDAVGRLQDENPSWDFKAIRNRLIHDGFDFRGKEPGKAVNMALISLRRKQAGGDESEQQALFSSPPASRS